MGVVQGGNLKNRILGGHFKNKILSYHKLVSTSLSDASPTTSSIEAVFLASTTGSLRCSSESTSLFSSSKGTNSTLLLVPKLCLIPLQHLHFHLWQAKKLEGPNFYLTP